LNTGGHSYGSLADYLRKDSLRAEKKIVDYYYLNGVVEMDNHEFIDSTKCVVIKLNIQMEMGFHFKEINNQTKLKVITIGRNYKY
jgi:hypothetical protein